MRGNSSGLRREGIFAGNRANARRLCRVMLLGCVRVTPAGGFYEIRESW